MGMRGAIFPMKKWNLPGASGFHELKFDCGHIGLGPMHVRMDGKRIAQFPKPAKKQPAVTFGPIVLDGHEVVFFAESHDFGDTVMVDVFVDGVSLRTGAGLTSLPARTTSAGARSATYTSPLDSVVVARTVIGGTVACWTGLGALRAVVQGGLRSPGMIPLMVLYFLGLWFVGWLSLRLLAGVGKDTPRRRLRVLGVALFDLGLSVAVAGALLALTFLV